MSTVAVDPRIRARRASVARDAGRRRLRRLLALAAVIGVALLALALTWTPALDIERIDVRGASHTSPDAVTEAAGITPGDPLAWFDADAAEQGIAALPWVDDVVITRSWTGEVGIEVTERTPVAGLVARRRGGLAARRRRGPGARHRGRRADRCGRRGRCDRVGRAR